ncbi:type III polyketide synthase [Deinococcus radiophilus]|uniref:Chalcone synthase n=1 Tax=Deinococcus radiophilus TaxID=32062 RepID=A0A3S0KHE1_9DEIO|nr:3-oxoacyl-[acyl-carrier-protein] synthase III C-terminal domain-containing protein [Deinococcus radiophilus]RTR30883.1 chalcone synthase [Deinococcus radiophilus]
MTDMPVLRSLVTGTPPHRAGQTEIGEVAQAMFPRLAGRRNLLDVFGNAQIESRALACPLEWYQTPRTFGEKNAAFVQEARRLCAELGAQAIRQAGVQPQDISAVVVVNTTGISTPSLDAYLTEALGLSRQVARVPLWGLGCAGGAAGLARAADLVRGGHKAVLYVAVELCSLTLLTDDESASNWVGLALFADGAAAAVLTAPDLDAAPPRLALHSARSTLIPDSEDIMGWDVVDSGLKVRFSRDIPALVTEMMADNVAGALAQAGWTRDQVNFWAVHPGGVKVLEAYAGALQLPAQALAASWDVLRHNGNMSSVTVLFVLRQLLDQGVQGRGLLSAMGPGFSAEQVLIEAL